MNENKICRQCLIEKDLESFRIVKKYHLNTCKQCYKVKKAAYDAANKVKKAAYNAAWRKDNNEKCVATSAAWYEDNKVKKAAYYEANKGTIAAKQAIWREDNREKCAATIAAWQKDNKAAVNAAVAKRKAAKLNRTPKWTTETDLWMIDEIYELSALRTKLTGVKCQVDHIIPLQGKLVSGLHVPSNLQVITATENKIKGNRFEVSV
jgi:hypothetical protein